MTKLTPMEEALFQAWARAHRISDHDDPKNIFDYRKIYKDTNGQIHPPGMLTGMAQSANSAVGDAQNGQQGDMIDPAMAAVEHQKNLMEDQHKQADREHKAKMNTENNQTKLKIKQMEIEHKTRQAQEDRQQKQVEAQQAREQAAQQSQMERQTALEQAQMGHQHEMERAQVGFQHEDQQAQLGHQHEVEQARMGHQHSLQEAEVGHQHEAHNQVMTEQMERSRPQPQPQQDLQPHQMLGRELLKRGMGAGQPGRQ